MAHERGTRVLIGDPGRPYFPRFEMKLLAEFEVSGCRDLEDADVKWAAVFTFR
jgi:predicted nicotinamide N-methyase